MSSGTSGSTPERHEPEVRRRELPPARIAVGVAVRRELLEVRHLADVDLGGEMAADRLLERLAGGEDSARERPGAAERLARALPEERLQPAVAHLEDDGEAAVPWSGKLADRFTTHSQKLATGESLHGETRIRLGRARARRRHGGGRGRVRRQRRDVRRDDRDAYRDDAREGAQGGARRGRRRAQRQRLQRARLQGPQAGGAGARNQGPRRRVELGGRLRPEHDDACAPGLRPDHRRRVRAG